MHHRDHKLFIYLLNVINIVLVVFISVTIASVNLKARGVIVLVKVSVICNIDVVDCTC